MTGRRNVDLLDDRTVEHLLTGRSTMPDPGVQRLLTELRGLGEGPAPRPAGALADLLASGFEPPIVPVRRPANRRRRWAARGGGVLAAAMTGVLLAGTAHALPPAVQNAVADLVAALTPVELPRSPVADDAVPQEQVPGERIAPSPVPAPAPVPDLRAPAEEGPAGSTPEAGDDETGEEETERPRSTVEEPDETPAPATRKSAERTRDAAEEETDRSGDGDTEDDGDDEDEDEAQVSADEEEESGESD